MSLFTKLGNEIASPVDAAGNPRAVENVDMQRWMTEVERATLAFQAGGGIIFPDLETANASLAYAQNQMAWVIGDPVPANNGVYRKIGASGSGSWARLGDLPISMIRLDNAGAGTADAIIAEPMLPLPTTSGAALLTVNILAANTGSVTLNGKPLRTNSGNEIAPGGLTAGSIHAFLDLGDHFRLLSDQASDAIVAAAEAAQAAAEAAQAAAEGAAAGVHLPVIGSGDAGKSLVVKQGEDGYELLNERGVIRVANRTALKALNGANTPVAYLYSEAGRNGIFAWLAGNRASLVASDPGEGVYVAPATDPTGASGVWQRQYTGDVWVTWFGAVGDNTTDNTTAIQRAINFSSYRRLLFPNGIFRFTKLTIQNTLVIKGAGPENTVLRSTQAEDDAILIDCQTTLIAGLSFFDIYIDASVQKNSGTFGLRQTAADGGAVHFLRLANVIFGYNLRGGLSLQCSYFAVLRGVTVLRVGAGGIGFQLMGASTSRRVVETLIDACSVRSGLGSGAIGIVLDSYSEGTYLRAVNVESTGLVRGVVIRNSLYPDDANAADSIRNIFCSQLIADNSAFYCLHIEAGRTIVIENSWFCSAVNNHGIRIDGGFDIRISGSTIANNGQHGIFMADPAQNVNINDCGIYQNSITVNGDYSGIAVNYNMKGFTIVGCQFHRTPGSTKRQKHAVWVGGGSSEDYIITNNRDRGSLDATSYSIGGSTAFKVVANNLN